MAKLEVCVDSLESAIAAIKGGADRLEVCGPLAVGGTTPAMSLVHAIDDYIEEKRLKDVKQMLMIRPRAGDFCYSKEEVTQMEYDISHFAKVGWDSIGGFVFGCLSSDMTIDESSCKELIEAARDSGDFQLTFHRAFDLTMDWKKSIDSLAKLKFDNLLTSGWAKNVTVANNRLAEIIKYAQTHNLKVISGGGVTSNNVPQVIGMYTDKQNAYIHSSCSVSKRSPIKLDKNPNARNLDASEFLNWKVAGVNETKAIADIAHKIK